MTSEPRYPLHVDILVAGARISGVVDLAGEGKRLIDVLNDGHSLMEMHTAQVTGAGTAHTQEIASLMVEKSSMLMAIPRETREQVRLRALQRNFLGSQATMQAWASLILPGISIQGLAHGPQGSGKLPADPAVFSRFFLVTDVQVLQPDGSKVELPVVAVNRDQIVAVSLLSERELGKRASA